MEKTAFDRTVDALKQQGMNSDEILNELSLLFLELTKGENVVAKNPNKPAESSVVDREKEYELKIKKLLNEFGIPCKLKGYDLLVQAIKLYSKNPKQQLFKELYYELAQIFNASPKTIGRNIHYAIEWGMDNIPESIYKEKFAYKIRDGRPGITNTEFINRCVQILSE